MDKVHLYCTHTHTHTHYCADSEEYATVPHTQDGSPVLGKLLSSRDIVLLDKIGEGQFGDVHKGILFPDVSFHYLPKSEVESSIIKY